MSETLRPPASVATTCRWMSVRTAGVPEKVRVAASKCSQAGRSPEPTGVPSACTQRAL